METGIIYARQSSGSNTSDESISIEVQIENCRKWAAKRGVEIIGTFADANTSSELYPQCTEGIEAARCDRGFQKWRKEQLTKGRKEYKRELGAAFDFIKTERPNYIIVNTGNRLGRSASNSNLNNFMVSYLMEYNTSIVDVCSNNITDFSDRLMMAFRAMKDALDYQGLAEKRKSAMESVAKRKERCEALSYGYGVEMQERQVVFNAAKSEAVKYIFDSICNGMGYARILRGLTEKYQHLCTGRQWYKMTIRHIVSNPVYCGYMRLKDGLEKATNINHPIVSFAQWQKANEMMGGHIKGKQHGQHLHWLPFGGFLRCGVCGRSMEVHHNRGMLAQQCKGMPKTHTTRIRVDEVCGHDMRLSIQAIFMLNAMRSRKRLFAFADGEAKCNATRAEISKVETELRAKFRLIANDDDFEFFRGEIEAKKAELAELKKRLYAEESEATENVALLREQIEIDFHRLMEGELLPEQDYMRLLHETIREITVFSEKITIHLTDGRCFDLPRITAGRKDVKVIPKANILCHSEDESLEGIKHITIEFGEGGNEETLLDGDDVTVTLKS